MNILITGIHGFVGSNLVVALKERHGLYGLDIVTPEKDGVIKTFSWDDLDKEMPEFDAVIHLAAQIEVASSERDPLRDASLNIGGTLAVLEGARKAHVSRFVFASSAAVYGHPSEALLPLAEERLYVRCLLMD